MLLVYMYVVHVVNVLIDFINAYTAVFYCVRDSASGVWWLAANCLDLNPSILLCNVGCFSSQQL